MIKHAFQKFLELLCINSYVLYYTDLRKKMTGWDILPEGICVQCCRSQKDVSEQDETIIMAHSVDKNLQTNIKDRFAKGAELWLVKVNGKLAGYTWTMRGDSMNPQVIPMTPNDVHFFDNWIFEEFRGKGINPVLMNYVICAMHKQHCVYALAETLESNTSERHSLAKTGFREHGYVKKNLPWRRKRLGLWRKPVSFLLMDNKNIEVEIYDSFEKLHHIRNEWDDFVKSLDCEIFLSYDWCRIWWKYYGGARSLSVFVFRENGSIVGILPLFFEKIGLGPFAVRTVKLVGSDFSISQFSIPVKPSYMELVLKVFSILMLRKKWDILHLGPIAGKYDEFEKVTQAFIDNFKNAKCVKPEEKQVQTYFQLDGDFETYLSGLSKKERSNIKRSYKGLSQMPEIFESSLATENNLSEYFDGFLSLHQSHWKKLGKAGHFGDWPHAVEFHRELASTNLGLDRLRLLKISMGRQCFGYQYIYKFGNMYCQFMDARQDEDISNEISLGRVTFCETVKKALEDDVKLIDSLRGRYDHKLRLGGKILPIKSFCVVPRKVSSLVKVTLLRIFARIINIFYYKVWYRRIAPRLSGVNKPLWNFWIRTQSFA